MSRVDSIRPFPLSGVSISSAGITTQFFFLSLFGVEEGGKFSGEIDCTFPVLLLGAVEATKGEWGGYSTFAEGRNEDNYTPVVLLSVKEYCLLYIKPNYKIAYMRYSRRCRCKKTRKQKT